MYLVPSDFLGELCLFRSIGLGEASREDLWYAWEVLGGGPWSSSGSDLPRFDTSVPRSPDPDFLLPTCLISVLIVSMMFGRILTNSSDSVRVPLGFSDRREEIVAALALKASTFFWTFSFRSRLNFFFFQKPTF